MATSRVELTFKFSKDLKNKMLGLDVTPKTEVMKISYNKHQLKGFISFEDNEISLQIIQEALEALNSYIEGTADFNPYIEEVY